MQHMGCTATSWVSGLLYICSGGLCWGWQLLPAATNTHFAGMLAWGLACGPYNYKLGESLCSWHWWLMLLEQMLAAASVHHVCQHRGYMKYRTAWHAREHSTAPYKTTCRIWELLGRCQWWWLMHWLAAVVMTLYAWEFMRV